MSKRPISDEEAEILWQMGATVLVKYPDFDKASEDHCSCVRLGWDDVNVSWRPESWVRYSRREDFCHSVECTGLPRSLADVWHVEVEDE